ncbi:DedA family protein [Microvirgula curvata]|uniref:DedA family protein n=1 Tax=Microvirgula aerodenitrificans TaxID=57480 RepID=A0A2S0PB27_9NEIS|nr:MULTISPECIES: DedA family protein [Microvirgula]AVY94513.1 DedA family protein [Microvirgula aerodenitrificans]RAS19062.1 membrane-associated protein [Microvirgula sp. AG722]
MEFISFIIDFILHIDVHLTELVAAYGPWIYLILFLIVFCETGLVVMPFLPGDSLLFVAGAIAALGGMDVHLLVITLIAAAVIGDTVNYQIGKYFGHRLFSNPDSRVFRRAYLEKTHDFYARHGGKTIILARFVPIVRTFAPFVAGIGGMGYRKFLSFNLVGAVLWVAGICYAGYLFGNLPVIRSNLSLLIVAIVFVSFLPGLIELWRVRRLR